MIAPHSWASISQYLDLLSGISGDPHSLGELTTANAGEVCNVSIPSKGQE